MVLDPIEVQNIEISEAIEWIKKNYMRPMNVEMLAKEINMSTSRFHHKFKAVTTMAPLQYQKKIRLLEARKMLLSGTVDAATAAFSVGYESPSQFSREYHRLFGAPPLKDIERLKNDPLRNPGQN